MIYVVLVAVGLAIDAFCVSVSLNLSKQVTHRNDKLKVAASFGIFQGVMPIIGYVAIMPFITDNARIIKFVSFAFLLYLAIKMFLEARNVKEEEEINERITNKEILVFSLATSIDALLAGLIIQTFKTPLVISILTIFIVTFVFSLVGCSYKFKSALVERYSEVLGGIVLLILAIRVILP